MRLTELTFCLVLTGGLAALGGCGIKPATLSSPPGTRNNTYPRIYPDPATDLKPPPPPQQESTQQP